MGVSLSSLQMGSDMDLCIGVGKKAPINGILRDNKGGSQHGHRWANTMMGRGGTMEDTQ